MKEIDQKEKEQIMDENMSEEINRLYDVFGEKWLEEIIAATRQDNPERFAAAIKEGREPVSDSLTQGVARGIRWFDSVDEIKECVTLNEIERLDLVEKVYDSKDDDIILRLPNE